MASNDIGEFLRGIPLVTRMLFLGTLGVTLGANFGLIPIQHLFLDQAVFTKFEIWRFPGSLLFGGRLGFPFLMNLYFLYNYSKSLETGLFEGRKADYVFFILFCWAVLTAIGLGFGIPTISGPLIFCIVYLWSQVNRDAVVSFMFGMRFKAMYLPWVLLGWTLLLGGSPIFEFIGIVVGHLYYFLEHLYPASSGVHLLQTPSFLRQYFPDERPAVHGFAPTNMPRPGGPTGPNPPPQGGGYNWGRGGNRLGDQ